MKTSAPLIKEQSQAISELFYKNLLKNHPDVKNIYNVSHIHLPDGKIGPQVSRYPRTVKVNQINFKVKFFWLTLLYNYLGKINGQLNG